MRRKDWLVGAASASGLVAAQQADAAMIGARRALLSGGGVGVVQNGAAFGVSVPPAPHVYLKRAPKTGNLLLALFLYYLNDETAAPGWTAIIINNSFIETDAGSLYKIASGDNSQLSPLTSTRNSQCFQSVYEIASPVAISSIQHVELESSSASTTHTPSALTAQNYGFSAVLQLNTLAVLSISSGWVIDAQGVSNGPAASSGVAATAHCIGPYTSPPTWSSTQSAIWTSTNVTVNA